MAQDANEKKEKKVNHREYLSLFVTVSSMAGVFGIAIIVIYMGGADKSVAQMVMTATLPLFGAWVGTILAFYFGRENFEAATRSVTAIAKSLSPEEKLKTIPVKEKMRRRDEMEVLKKPADQIGGIKLVDEILDKLDKTKDKVSRLPILNDQDHLVYMVHRSAVEQYLVKKAMQPSPPNLKDLTLQNLLDEDAGLKQLLETSFAIIKEDATLADVKLKMDPNRKIQDVFVTKGGGKNEPVIGWITNTKLQEAATV